MKTYVTLPVLAMFAFSFPLLADKKSVDCNKGQNLNKAVQSLSSGDTLTFTGACNENVTIVTSGITIAGSGTAVIQSPSPTNDTLTIIGEQRGDALEFLRSKWEFRVARGGQRQCHAAKHRGAE